MFYVVSISWWAASRADDRVHVYLEYASSVSAAAQQAKKRLSFIEDNEYSVDDHIFDISCKEVNSQNIGLVYAEEQ